MPLKIYSELHSNDVQSVMDRFSKKGSAGVDRYTPAVLFNFKGEQIQTTTAALAAGIPSRFNDLKPLLEKGTLVMQGEGKSAASSYNKWSATAKEWTPCLAEFDEFAPEHRDIIKKIMLKHIATPDYMGFNETTTHTGGPLKHYPFAVKGNRATIVLDHLENQQQSNHKHMHLFVMNIWLDGNRVSRSLPISKKGIYEPLEKAINSDPDYPAGAPPFKVTTVSAEFTIKEEAKQNAKDLITGSITAKDIVDLDKLQEQLQEAQKEIVSTGADSQADNIEAGQGDDPFAGVEQVSTTPAEFTPKSNVDIFAVEANKYAKAKVDEVAALTIRLQELQKEATIAMQYRQIASDFRLMQEANKKLNENVVREVEKNKNLTETLEAVKVEKEEQFTNFSNEIVTLKETVREQHETIVANKVDYENLENQFQEATQELESVRAIKEAIAEDLRVEKENAAQLRNLNSALDEKIKEQEKTLGSNKEQIKLLSDRVVEQDKEKKALKAENSTLTGEKAELLTTNTFLNTQVDELKAQVERLTALTTKMEIEREQREANFKEVEKKLNATLANLESSKKETQASYGRLRTLFSAKDDDIDTIIRAAEERAERFKARDEQAKIVLDFIDKHGTPEQRQHLELDNPDTRKELGLPQKAPKQDNDQGNDEDLENDGGKPSPRKPR